MALPSPISKSLIVYILFLHNKYKKCLIVSLSTPISNILIENLLDTFKQAKKGNIPLEMHFDNIINEFELILLSMLKMNGYLIDLYAVEIYTDFSINKKTEFEHHLISNYNLLDYLELHDRLIISILVKFE